MSMLLQVWLLPLIFASAVDATHAGFSFQSGPYVGGITAGGMVVYENQNDSPNDNDNDNDNHHEKGDSDDSDSSGKSNSGILITGSTHGALAATEKATESSCFVGLLDETSLLWIDQDSLGNENININEQCGPLGLLEAHKEETLIVGTTTSGEDESENSGGGFLLRMSYTHGQVVGPQLSRKELIAQTPLAMVSDSSAIYLVALQTETSSYDDGQRQPQAVLQHYSMHDLQASIQLVWSHNINLSNSNINDANTKAYLQEVGDYLVAAIAPSNNASPSLLVFNKVGTLLHSVTCQHDITNVCAGNSDNNDGALFAIGSNSITKYQVFWNSGIDTRWTQSIVSDIDPRASTIQARECLVDDIDTANAVVYVAGTYRNTTQSDIFVTQYIYDSTGEQQQQQQHQLQLKWMQTIASDQDDALATDGALAVQSIQNLNYLIVYGTTYGSLYRQKDDQEPDIFLARLSKTDGSSLLAEKMEGSSYDDSINTSSSGNVSVTTDFDDTTLEYQDNGANNATASGNNTASNSNTTGNDRPPVENHASTASENKDCAPNCNTTINNNNAAAGSNTSNIHNISGGGKSIQSFQDDSLADIEMEDRPPPRQPTFQTSTSIISENNEDTQQVDKTTQEQGDFSGNTTTQVVALPFGTNAKDGSVVADDKNADAAAAAADDDGGHDDDDDDDDDHIFVVSPPAPEQTLTTAPSPTYMENTTTTSSFEGAFGIQLKGPMYAGGIAYDSINDVLRFTGGTYSYDSKTSQCYMATVSLKDPKANHIEPIAAVGNDTVDTVVPSEACSSLAMARNNNGGVVDYVYLIGGTESGGSFTNDFGMVNDISPVTQYGTVFQVNLNHRGDVAVQQENSRLTGGYLFQENVVTYPVAVLVDDSQDFVYVASMVSTSGEETADATLLKKTSYPNLSPLGGYRKYGFQYDLQFSKLRVSKARDADVNLNRLTLSQTFEVSYTTEDGTSVYASAMAMVGAINEQQEIVLVGSTRGSGSIFGENDKQEDGNGDMDGFIVKLNMATGTVSAAGGRSSTRINLAFSRDDWILGVCNDPNDNNAFYIVGAAVFEEESNEGNTTTTLIDESIHPFVAKMDMDTLAVVWHNQLRVTSSNSNPTDSSSYACVVDSASQRVYAAGIVKDGAAMGFGGQISKGEDDIFVTQLDTSDGSIQWMKQIGTSGSDRLAHGDGLSIDKRGNPLIVAETTGKLFRVGDVLHDVVVMTLSKEDGSYKPVYTPKSHNEGKTAFQSGSDIGPSYAGGMSYDLERNELYITGSTNHDDGSSKAKSSCFVGVIQLSDMELEEYTVFGTPNTVEACSTIEISEHEGFRASVIAGVTEKGGLFNDFANNADAIQYAFVLDAEGSTSNNLVGGVMDRDVVQHPMAIKTDSINNQVYVVSMNSQEAVIDPSYKEREDMEYPNLTTGGYPKYGSSFSVVVNRFTFSHVEATGALTETMELEYSKVLDLENDNGSVFATDIMTIGGENPMLLVVGSTRESQKNPAMDGFIAKVNPQDGKLVDAVTFVATSDGRDAWITKACEDPNDKNSFYIVGGTMGVLDETVERSEDDYAVHAFVSKMNISNMSTIWTKQFSISQTASDDDDKEFGAALALGCNVVAGENLVYVAGVVEHGATIDFDAEPQISSGSDDIFVVQLNTRNGSIRWLKQVGSSGMDRLARGGGVVSDKFGNAIVFGDTTGHMMYRPQSQDSKTSSDIFVLLLGKVDGAYELPLTRVPESDDNEEVGKLLPLTYSTGGMEMGWVIAIIAPFVALLVFGGSSLLAALYRPPKRFNRKARPGALKESEMTTIPFAITRSPKDSDGFAEDDDASVASNSSTNLSYHL